MPTILLARHAQASYGASDYDVLSSRGEEQSQLLAADLARRRVRVERVVSGTLVRQRDTATPIATAAGVRATVDPRWDEYPADDILNCYSDSSVRLEHTSREGPELRPREFQDVLDTALLAWIAADTGARTVEPWPAFSARVNVALGDLARELGRGETALVCTSGGVLAAICVHLLRAPARAFVQFNRVAVNTGVTKVIHGGRGTTLVSFNEHGHLERPGGSLITYR